MSYELIFVFIDFKIEIKNFINGQKDHMAAHINIGVKGHGL